MPEAGHHRLKTFFHLVLSGGGDAGERPSVKGIRRGQNFKPAFVMAEFPRQLEQAFVRLRAAVAEKNFAGADAFDEFGGQPALRLGEIKIRDVDEFFGLLDERLGDGRVRVAEAIHGDAAAEVEIALARDIKDVAARAVAQHEVKASVAGHDIFREQFADGLVVVAHNGRRCWNNFFHLRLANRKSKIVNRKLFLRRKRVPGFRVERADDGVHGEIARQFAAGDKFNDIRFVFVAAQR